MQLKTQHSSRMFGSGPKSAAHVREYVRDSLETWRVSSETAVFLANELATNAIVHAHGDFLVEMSLSNCTCRIEVVDHDPHTPRATKAATFATSGRGLALVEALSDSWGVESRDAGKGVWCDVPVAPTC